MASFTHHPPGGGRGSHIAPQGSHITHPQKIHTSPPFLFLPIVFYSYRCCWWVVDNPVLSTDRPRQWRWRRGAGPPPAPPGPAAPWRRLRGAGTPSSSKKRGVEVARVELLSTPVFHLFLLLDGVDREVMHETLMSMKHQLFKSMSVSLRQAQGRALALRVEPAAAVSSATGAADPSRGYQGEGQGHPPRLRLTPSGGPRRPQAAASESVSGTCRPGLRPESVAAPGGNGALAARRPSPVRGTAQHRSPDSFASSANASPWARLRRFGVLRAAFIKLRFTKLPRSELRPWPTLWHGEELRGTVQAKGRLHGQQTTVVPALNLGARYMKGEA